MRQYKLFIRMTMVLGILIFLGSCTKSESASKSTKKISEEQEMPASYDQPRRPAGAIQAPDFTLSTVDGEWVNLKSLKGNVILLNFWGTWCAPCRREIPDFVKLYDNYQSDGLEIVGVTLNSGTPDNIANFMQQYGMNYTILTDIKGNETQKVTQVYSEVTGKPISGIPTTFLIDRNGYIVKRYLGPRTENVFYKDIKPYL